MILLIGAMSVGYVWLDRWQRETIFAIELGEAHWARPEPSDTRIYDLTHANGDKIRAWYIGQTDSTRPTVLYLHGSRWNLNSSVFRIERWRAMGYNILAIDYRGFGESTPLLPSQASAVEDAIVAIGELERLQPDPSLRYVYGHSLGGAIASLALKEVNPGTAGLILESTFTNIQDMLVTSEWADIPALKWLITQPFNTLDAVKDLNLPTLVMHGENDRVVPPAMSDTLFAHAAGGSLPASRLVKFKHTSHFGSSRSTDYAPVVTTFISNAGQAFNDIDTR